MTKKPTKKPAVDVDNLTFAQIKKHISDMNEGNKPANMPVLRSKMYDLIIDRVPVKRVDMVQGTGNQNDVHTWCVGWAKRLNCVLKRINTGDAGAVEFCIKPHGETERDPDVIHDRLTWSPEHKCKCHQGNGEVCKPEKQGDSA